MPISFIKNNSGNKIGLWEIKETRDDLLKLHTPLSHEITQYDSLKAEQKKIQWLAVRALLKQMGEQGEIRYDEHNKPHIDKSNIFISISHTNNYVAVILSSTNHVGIDIETPSEKVLRIAHKFMNETEFACLNHQHKISHATLFWCAKEAAYKMFGRKELLFKEQILIEPFNYADSGNIRVNIVKDNFNKFYKLYYETVNGNKLVYTVNE